MAAQLASWINVSFELRFVNRLEGWPQWLAFRKGRTRDISISLPTGYSDIRASLSVSGREMRDMIALRSFASGVAADEPELVGDAGSWSRTLMTMTPSGNGGH